MEFLADLNDTTDSALQSRGTVPWRKQANMVVAVAAVTVAVAAEGVEMARKEGI